MYREREDSDISAVVVEKKIHPVVATFLTDFKEATLLRFKKDEDFVTFVLGGGAGFGDFNPTSSDLDIFLVIPNTSLEEKLVQIHKIASIFEIMVGDLNNQGKIPGVGFRHLPSIFTEDEFSSYCCAFAAKIGLPVSFGVFPSIVGKSYEGFNFVSQNQLESDLAYSMFVFYSSIGNFVSDREEKTRFTFKRATYFLRFLTLLEEGLYIPNQSVLLEHVERYNSRWFTITHSLQFFLETGQLPTNISGEEFVKGIQEIMLLDIAALVDRGVITNFSINRGNVRTSLFWTLEKTRWDYLQLSRQPEILLAVMTKEAINWGHPFKQIDELFRRVFELNNNEDIRNDWDHFCKKHISALGELKERDYIKYYEEEYFPAIDLFMSRLLETIQRLY